MVTAWDELVRRALLGTDRDAAPVQWSGDDRVGEYVQRLDPAEPETALISTAALVVTHQQAGAVPRAATARDANIAPPEDLVPIGSRATADLAELLFSDRGRELLVEWLTVAASRGRIVSPVLLPALLEKGRRHPRFADRIRAVIGERGRWLAAQNPAWAYASNVGRINDEDFDRRWDAAPSSERALLIGRLREVDPHGARKRIEAAWTNERARDRAAFAETMLLGLSMEDEPFLEAALDDRSKDVRRVAARVLAHLSASRLSKRMAARARQFVRMEAGAFVVELPESVDESAQRDGIAKTATSSGGGRRSFWLSQILGLTPPSTFVHAFGRSPHELLLATRDSDWAGTLRAGFMAGAIVTRDPDWLEALILHRVDGEDALWNLLPAERREGLFATQLKNTKTRTEIHRVLLHLPKIPGPWGADFSSQIVGALGALVRSEERLGEFPAFSVLRDAGKKLSVDVLPALAKAHARISDTSYWKKAMNDGLETLQHRERILRALEEE